MFGRKKSGEMRLQDPLMVAFFDEDGALNVHLDPKQVPDAHAAGMILADFARHFSNMLCQTGKSSTETVAIAGIRAGFDSELTDPTDSPTGHIQRDL